MSTYPVVAIKWIDAYGCSPGWTSLSELEEESKTVHCYSLGYLTKKTEKEVTLIPHLAESPDGTVVQGCGDMTIPVVCILEMTYLEEEIKKSAKKSKSKK